MLLCPDPNKGDTLAKISAEVTSWITTLDLEVQGRMYSCIEREVYWAIQLLLCEGEESREKISMWRHGVIEILCAGKNDLLCGILIWITEPEQVEFMIEYMKDKEFCKEVKDSEIFTTNTADIGGLLPGKRQKRQYDLMTLYDVYISIFCSSTKEEIYKSEDNSIENFSPEVKFITFILKFRGPVCCFASKSFIEYL